MTASETRVLVRCQAGCDTDDVLAALGLTKADLFDTQQHRNGSTIVAQYNYTDEEGDLLFQVVRLGPQKSFWQRRPDGSGGWIRNLDGTRRVLYRLPEVLDAIQHGQRVYVCEGEKDADAIRDHGGCATTNPGGAGKWRDEFTKVLAGGNIAVVADRDKPGRDHARNVAASLRDRAASVVVLEPVAGKDVADHLAAGRTLDELVEPEDVREHDGTALLDDVETFIARYVAYPSEAARVAAALWVAHAHAVEHFESTPRLAHLSPEPASGKTRSLEVYDLLVPHPMHAVSATPAALFRSVADLKHRPTILFDEIDTIFGPRAKENEELRGLLNAGHRRGAVAYRCVGEGTRQKVVAFPAYAAVALAGLGDLPDTLMSRSVVLRMRRRARHEHVEPFRRRTAEEAGVVLRTRLAGWAEHVAGPLAEARPAMPPGVEDRPADVWEPLLAIADAAGGDWPDRARTACTQLVAEAVAGEPSINVRLLADLRGVFGTEAQAMHTEDILNGLHALPEAPWADLRGKPLDARRLAQRLGRYGVASKDVKLNGVNRKGYTREALWDAWERYLPAEPADTPPPSHGSATSATNTRNSPLTSGNAVADEVADCPEVADTNATRYASATAEPRSDQRGSAGSAGSASPAEGREESVPEVCSRCRQPLLLRAPGRDICERCRLSNSNEELPL